MFRQKKKYKKYIQNRGKLLMMCSTALHYCPVFLESQHRICFALSLEIWLKSSEEEKAKKRRIKTNLCEKMDQILDKIYSLICMDGSQVAIMGLFNIGIYSSSILLHHQRHRSSTPTEKQRDYSPVFHLHKRYHKSERNDIQTESCVSKSNTSETEEKTKVLQNNNT